MTMFLIPYSATIGRETVIEASEKPTAIFCLFAGEFRIGGRKKHFECIEFQ
jgi:hypothetical protein